MRRIRPTPGSQLPPDVVFDYHAILTDRTEPMLQLEADHCRRAVVELAIRDLKAGGHITTLLLTFFYRLTPKLIEKGHLYLAQPPLYQLRRGSTVAYAMSDPERKQLWATTMDPSGAPCCASTSRTPPARMSCSSSSGATKPTHAANDTSPTPTSQRTWTSRLYPEPRKHRVREPGTGGKNGGRLATRLSADGRA